jgi:transcriptional regulator GlxA family with amidase domain
VLSLSFPISAYRERHFTVAELAELWHFSPDTIRRLFENECGVIVIHNPRRRTRTYKTLRIPERVAARVYSKLTNGDRNGSH